VPGIYRIARSLYRAVLPLPMRGIFEETDNPIGRIAVPLRRSLGRFARHDEIYHAEYYAEVDAMAQRSANEIAASIVDEFHPQTLVDVGCGTGALLVELRERGVAVCGLEYAAAAIDLCRARGLDVLKFDLERESGFDRRCDVVVSTEVGEHLPRGAADRYVDLLCGSGQTVVFTAAHPGQGGKDHVNEQPKEYWVEKFAKRGLRPDRATRDRLVARWAQADVELCYRENLMIFRAARATARAAPSVRS
jgi:SAM-dependent methyltransferase